MSLGLQLGRVLVQSSLGPHPGAFSESGICPLNALSSCQEGVRGVGGMGGAGDRTIGASPALWLRDLLGGYPTNAALRIVRAFYSSATHQLRAPDPVTFSSGSQFPHLYNEGIGINSLKGPFQSCVRDSDSNCIKLSTYGCWTVSCIRTR